MLSRKIFICTIIKYPKHLIFRGISSSLENRYDPPIHALHQPRAGLWTGVQALNRVILCLSADNDFQKVLEQQNKLAAYYLSMPNGCQNAIVTNC